MNDKEMRELDVWIESNLFGGQKYGLKKRGSWYRPDAKGYTDRQSEAWRLSLEDAKKHEYKKGSYDEWVVVMPIDCPRYTTDPAAAMMVLEKCAEECKKGKFNDSIDVRKTKSGFEVGRMELEYDWSIRHQSKAATLPIAICLFAKKLFQK